MEKEGKFEYSELDIKIHSAQNWKRDQMVEPE